jgi:hypothetical protein
MCAGYHLINTEYECHEVNLRSQEPLSIISSKIISLFCNGIQKDYFTCIQNEVLFSALNYLLHVFLFVVLSKVEFFCGIMWLQIGTLDEF